MLMILPTGESWRRGRTTGQPSAGHRPPQLIVKDTRLAFGELAAWVRSKFRRAWLL